MKKGPKEPTKTSSIPQVRISEMEKAELEKCRLMMNESISEYIRRSIIERNARIIEDWHKRKEFLES